MVSFSVARVTTTGWWGGGGPGRRETRWLHCDGKFIFKPIVRSFHFDNSPLVCFSLPSTEGQWMLVRSGRRLCVCVYVCARALCTSFRDNCCARGVRPPPSCVCVCRIAPDDVQRSRPFAFRARRDRIAAVVNASR